MLIYVVKVSAICSRLLMKRALLGLETYLGSWPYTRPALLLCKY